mgnify:CR=1 FL=1
MDLNESMEEIIYGKGQRVYHIGQPAEVFYIVREGEAVQETVLELEENMKYPVDSESWEIKRTTKLVNYTIRILGKSDYFGHEEMLNGN